MRTNRRTFPAAEVRPESLLAPLVFENVFGRAAPIEVDLGCGDGTFLSALARANPERNFLGVELTAGRVRAACRKIGDGGLTNARILRLDILHAVQQLIPRRSVDVFHLMFPDPWPKHRHRARRIVTEAFLRAIARGLTPGGALQIATDHADYFREMQRTISRVSGFEPDTDGDSLPSPRSTFEERFRERGNAIHRLVLRTVSDDR